MQHKVYFDTSTFREIGKSLENTALPDDIREHIVVSPISAFEVFSQLTILKADEVLRQIQAIHNWINSSNAGLLPWPDDVLANVGFGKAMRDDDFTLNMATAFNACLGATSPALLQDEAGKLKDTMDAMKLKSAQDFDRLIEAARKESPKDGWFLEPWYQGIAKRANADPRSKSAGELAVTFCAYHEFDRVKLEAALRSKDYNAEKHKNDLFDGEQLVYLSSPELVFLTCDTGFARVNTSPQARRIGIVSPQELSDVNRVENVLRQLVTQACRAERT